jgi:hypothetical protein
LGDVLARDHAERSELGCPLSIVVAQDDRRRVVLVNLLAPLAKRRFDVKLRAKVGFEAQWNGKPG